MEYSHEEEEDYRIFYGNQSADHDPDNAGEQSQEDVDAEAINAGSKYAYGARKRLGLAAQQPLWPGSEDQGAAGSPRAAARPSEPFSERLDGIMHEIINGDAPPQQDFSHQGPPPSPYQAPSPAAAARHRPQQNFRPRSGVTLNHPRAPSNLNPGHHGNPAAAPILAVPAIPAAFDVDQELVEAYRSHQQAVAAARVSPRKPASKVHPHLRRATTNAAIAAGTVTPLLNLRQQTPAAPAGPTTTPTINPGNPMLGLRSTGARRTAPPATGRPLANLSSTPGSGPARGGGNRARRDPIRLRQPALDTPAGGAAFGGDFSFPAAAAGATTCQEQLATADDAIASESDSEGHPFIGMGGGGSQQATPHVVAAAGVGLAHTAPPSKQAKLLASLHSPPRSPRTRKRGGALCSQMCGALTANAAAMTNPNPHNSLIITLQGVKEVESGTHKWRCVSADGRSLCVLFPQKRLAPELDMRPGSRLKLTPPPRVIAGPGADGIIIPISSSIEQVPLEALQFT